MAKKKKQGKRQRTVMFVYCSEELKRRVQQAARHVDRDLSRYVVFAVKRQLETDEAEMRRR